RRRLAPDEAFDGWTVHRDLARQSNHCLVDQLHGGGTELDDVLRRIHRLVERGEVADAENAIAWDRLEIELDRLEEGERSFRADEQMRHVVAGVGDHVDVVATDLAQKLGN